MFAAQMPMGGFPQRYPSPAGYSAHITFNDGVMIGILSALKDAADRQPQWMWLDAARRDKAQRAVQLGVDCILKCQIRVEGNLTGWCQQHDEKSFEPRPARTFELASLCPQDTTEIVRFLMRLESPSVDVVRAVETAVGWLRRVQLGGIRVERVKATKEEFLRHTADYDVVVVQDLQAPPSWARHYEIGTDRPVFAGRDGVRRYVLSEVERERRTGSAWYGNWPQKLLETEYPKWRADIRQEEGR
jgi:PelA/Pel-15E family pectate lyase